MKALLALALFGAAPAMATGPSPAPVEQWAAKDACTDLLLTYAQGLDQRDPLKIWPLFTQDGVWTADGKVTMNGQVALRTLWEGLAAQPRPTVGRHAASNIRFTVEDANHARGSALIVQYRYDPAALDGISDFGPMMLVDVTMDCVRQPEGWRFQRMELKSVSATGYVHGKG